MKQRITLPHTRHSTRSNRDHEGELQQQQHACFPARNRFSLTEGQISNEHKDGGTVSDERMFAGLWLNSTQTHQVNAVICWLQMII